MDNPEKLAMHFTTAGHTRQRKKNKQKKQPNTICVGQHSPQITLIRHEPSYK
jgi:hypothetical protein